MLALLTAFKLSLPHNYATYRYITMQYKTLRTQPVTKNDI